MIEHSRKAPIRVYYIEHGGVSKQPVLFERSSMIQHPGGVATASGRIGNQEIFFAAQQEPQGITTRNAVIPQLDTNGNLVGFETRPLDLDAL